MKRDSAVELLRLFGCLIVIGVHTCLNVVVNENYDFSRTYISCLLADGVAIFWIITGFFLFSNHDYANLLKRTTKNIVLPMMIVSILIFYFGDWLMAGTTFSESILHSSEEYRKVIKTLLTWRNPVNGMGHLWYLYIYVILIITFPVLKSFVKYLEKNNGEWRFVLISFVFLILNDITDNKLLGFSHYSINGWFPAAIEVIWGYILYQHKEDILKLCKSPLLWGICFATVNLVRGAIQFEQYQMGGGKHILYWYTSFGVVSAVCMMFFCFSIMNYINSQKLEHFICSLAGETFLIYLVHQCLNKMFDRFGIKSLIINILSKVVSGTLFEVLYTGIIIFLIFTVSLFLVKPISICVRKYKRRDKKCMII